MGRLPQAAIARRRPTTICDLRAYARNNGVPVDGELAAYRTIDPSDTQGNDLYFLITSIVVPRPIAWISTLAADGTMNLAPHSYTTVLSSNPAIVCFVSVGQKDSLRNAQATGDFVYNIAGEATRSGQSLLSEPASGRSEFDWTG